MKPEDLKRPFLFAERRVLLHDRVFFIPERVQSSGFILPRWQEIFDNTNPVKIEYCSGNGAWIAAQARAYPQFNWVAVEKKWSRVQKIWSKMKNHELSNLLIVSGEAFQATSEYITAASIAEVFVNFPDPWPKKKHWKNRLIQQPFLQEIKRILLPSGSMTLVTDDPEYSRVMIREVAQNKKFSSCFPDPFYCTDLPGYGSSYFEELWRAKGKEIRYHKFMRHD
jgi:tRNA (guanine-N7-)-methyltransferase